MDFKNSNIGAWIVEQVPCAFAKPGRNGEPGTHYVMVLLDKNKNVMYVGSECEHTHGDGIQALHELSEGNTTTCFKSSTAFRAGLGAIHNSKGVQINSSKQQELVNAQLPHMLNAALESVIRTCVKKHNTRVQEQAELSNGYIILGNATSADRKNDLMQRVANKVIYHAVNLKPLVTVGKNRGDTPVPPELYQKRDVNYVPIVRIYSRKLQSYEYDGIFQYVPSEERPTNDQTFVTMMLSGGYEAELVAAQDPRNGRWHINDSLVRRWAKQNHTCFNHDRSKAFGVSTDTCIFCQEKFSRMSRHMDGARHQNRVMELIQLATRATSRTGLRLLNNPRHFSAFYGGNR